LYFPMSLSGDTMWRVFTKAIGRWRLFKEIEPGHRFQTRYHSHRRRRDQGQTSKWVSLLNLVGGPALIVAGFAFIPTPGPSYIIIVIGDLGRLSKDRWSRPPAGVKRLVVLACVAALGYVAYFLLFGG
jgi:hypothetical protein